MGRLGNDILQHKCGGDCTAARLMYSSSNGLADCWRESRRRVKGDAVSRWFSRREMRRRLCVRRWEVSLGGIVEVGLEMAG